MERGDTGAIKPGMKLENAIRGVTELHIIKVQVGDDIERLDWNWRQNE